MNNSRKQVAVAPAAALLAILAITVAWWTLALWPTSPVTPDWIVRTRYVCFGDRGDGLPSTMGWLMLIGQPVSMLGFLMIVWGSDVSRSVRGLVSFRAGRFAAGVVIIALLGGGLAAALRVIAPSPAAASAPAVDAMVNRLDEPAPALTLTDQSGRLVSLADFRGRPVVVAFAYAHCATVCPLIVHDVKAALAQVPELNAAALVVSVDPWRDTPERLPSIAREWQLPPQAHLLSGPVEEVEAVLDAWKVGRARDRQTGEVTHTTRVYLIAPNGRIAYLAPSTTRELVAFMRQL
jgi:protein SCO1/2